MRKIKIKEVIIKLIEFGIKAKYISNVYFAMKFNIGLNEYSEVCIIETTNHTCHKALKNFEFENYKIERHYLGEFSETPVSKSFICKRTPEEIEILNRTHNPCIGCVLEKCDIAKCQAINNVNI